MNLATIIIPQFNHAALTIDCLRSLRANERTHWPVIVVDDGSDPAELHHLAACRFDAVRILEQTHQGLTAAWNAALATVETRFVLFLNNDVLFDGPAVERLIAPLARQGALLSGVRWRHESLLPPHILRALPTEYFLEGWCFAVEVDALRDAGGLDSTLHTYWSDTDLQARLLRDRPDSSRPCVCDSTLPLVHRGHQTARSLPERRALWRSDRQRFIDKWSAH